MNSQSGKKSFEDMKDMMRQAQTPQTYAMITEENWKSLIALLAHQISIMEQQQDILHTMITTEQMAGLISNQTENMQTYIEKLGSITEKHSKVMKAIESDFNKSVVRQTSVLKDETKKTMQEISLQAGRMKEDFSNSLSMEKEHMKDTLLKQRIINWALTAMQVLSLGVLILWVTSQTF